MRPRHPEKMIRIAGAAAPAAGGEPAAQHEKSAVVLPLKALGDIHGLSIIGRVEAVRGDVDQRPGWRRDLACVYG